MSDIVLKMSVLKARFAICRLEPDDELPSWPFSGDFISITKTKDELSIVCAQESIPEGIKCETDRRALKIEGPLDFSLTGILASISTTLAQNGISIFAISTYDTDYILVREQDLDNAISALAGDHIVT